jgi:transposase
MLAQSFAVLNQMFASLSEAKQAMVTAAAEFPEVRLLETAPSVGIITACRFVAYVQTPRRFSNKRKLWRYARLAVTRRESNGKRLSHPRLDSSGVGSLKDVSRKIFEAARRTKGSNSFKRCYEQSLERTTNAVHARLTTRAENPCLFKGDVALDAAVPRNRRLPLSRRNDLSTPVVRFRF